MTVYSDYTTPICVSIPAAPSDLAASAASMTAIDLTWIDNSNNETNFELQRDVVPTFDSPATLFEPAADATSYNDTGLTTGITYYYRIRAINTYGYSTYSSTVFMIAGYPIELHKHLYWSGTYVTEDDLRYLGLVDGVPEPDEITGHAILYVDELDGDLKIKDADGNVTTFGDNSSTVKVSNNDTTPGYLNGKLVAGTNITFAENNDGGNETLTINTSAVTDHGDLTGLSDDDHTQYHNDTRGDARYYTQTQLDAGQLDNRYYTETESDALYAAIAHTHDDRYYTETESDALYSVLGHTHDDRYYTETESDALYAAIVHTHDDRYYTETESDALYAPVSHAHSASDITSGILSPARGGTGVDNASRTLTIATNSGTIAFGAASKTLTVNENLTLSGATGKTLTLTGSLTVGADTTITGGGTIALAGYTLTVPATGTAALLGTANVFTAAQTINGNLTIDTDVLFVNASTNQVGIGTTSPSAKVDLFSGADGIAAKIFGANDDGVRLTLYAHDASEFVAVYAWDENDGGAAGYKKTYVGTTVEASALIVDGANSAVGIGKATPAAKLHIDQSSTTAAQPVLYLDQADTSEEFIRFVGTAANLSLTTSIVEEAAVSAAGRTGWLRIYVQDDGDQMVDQAYYIPFYSLA